MKKGDGKALSPGQIREMERLMAFSQRELDRLEYPKAEKKK